MIFLMILFTYANANLNKIESVTSVGIKVKNRWHWSSANHWSSFERPCEKLETGEIIFSVEDPKHYQVESELMRAGSSQMKNEKVGNLLSPLVLEEDQYLVKVIELKKTSSCLKLGSLLLINKNDVIQ